MEMERAPQPDPEQARLGKQRGEVDGPVALDAQSCERLNRLVQQHEENPNPYDIRKNSTEHEQW